MIRFIDVYKEYDNGTKALKGVSMRIDDGEFVFLVGPSGSGKSTIIKLITGEIATTEGRLMVNGYNMNNIRPGQVPYMRRTLGIIFQDFRLIEKKTVYENLSFAMRAIGASPRDVKRRIPYVLQLVGLDSYHLSRYPHELSGGQRQRVLIAMALTRDPKLVICDEPTTALDVTVQKQVIKLLNDLQAKLGFAMIFVSHDLALVAEVAHNITVMYAGQVIEQAPTKELLTNPIHEYTRGLLGSVLSIESGSGRLHQVPGAVPSPRDFPKGDRFAPRSSHPRIGLDTRPVFKRVPGTEHFYSELPDEVLKANGLTPHAEVM